MTGSIGVPSRRPKTSTISRSPFLASNRKWSTSPSRPIRPETPPGRRDRAGLGRLVVRLGLDRLRPFGDDHRPAVDRPRAVGQDDRDLERSCPGSASAATGTATRRDRSQVQARDVGSSRSRPRSTPSGKTDVTYGRRPGGDPVEVVARAAVIGVGDPQGVRRRRGRRDGQDRVGGCRRRRSTSARVCPRSSSRVRTPEQARAERLGRRPRRRAAGPPWPRTGSGRRRPACRSSPTRVAGSVTALTCAGSSFGSASAASGSAETANVWKAGTPSGVMTPSRWMPDAGVGGDRQLDVEPVRVGLRRPGRSWPSAPARRRRPRSPGRRRCRSASRGPSTRARPRAGWAG